MVSEANTKGSHDARGHEKVSQMMVWFLVDYTVASQFSVPRFSELFQFSEPFFTAWPAAELGKSYHRDESI